LRGASNFQIKHLYVTPRGSLRLEFWELRTHNTTILGFTTGIASIYFQSKNKAMNKLFQLLAFAGTIPFIFCTLLLITGVQSLPLLGKVDHILSVYGLVISAFMAGSHWGQHLNLNNKWKFYLPVFSNLAAVALWTGYIVFNPQQFLIALVMSFVVLLLIDNKLFKAGIITMQYFRTRCLVTSIVVASLLVAWASI
jgi:hypothetical protein